MTTQSTAKRGRLPGATDETLEAMQKVINFVRRYHKDNHFAPTLREICVGIGRKETDVGNIQRWIQVLIAEGFLVNAGKNQGRSLAVAKRPPRKQFYKSE